MMYPGEQEHKKKLERIRYQATLRRRKREIKEAKAMCKPTRKRITTAKFALWYIFISCTAVQIYAMAAMWHFGDLSPLISLIGATVGEVISFCAYAAKSAKENSKGGIVYDTAMKEQNEATEEPQG